MILPADEKKRMSAVPAVAAALDNLQQAQSLLTVFYEELRQKRHQEWLDTGGCERCNGAGTVCTWSTLDSLTGGYDEFGTCPSCQGESPRWPGSNEGRRSQHPCDKVHVPPLVQSADELAQERDLQENLDLAKVLHAAAVEEHAVAKDKTVRVVRGRKVPKGMEGTVCWIGEDRYSRSYKRRIGIKVDEYTVHWTAASNVEVVIEPTLDPEPMQAVDLF